MEGHKASQRLLGLQIFASLQKLGPTNSSRTFPLLVNKIQTGSSTSGSHFSDMEGAIHPLASENHSSGADDLHIQNESDLFTSCSP